MKTIIQRYKIILWKKAEVTNKTFDEISRETYSVLSVFRSFPLNLQPNYLTTMKKQEIKFKWDYSEFWNMLKDNVNKEGGVVFEDLGYSLSFFSDLDDNRSCNISVKVGNKDNRFVNSLIVDLPIVLNLNNQISIDLVNTMFEKLIESFIPFWGCVSNRALTNKYGRYLEDGVPTTLHWLNYWSDDIISRFGYDRLKNFISQNKTITIKNGIISIRNNAFVYRIGL